MNASPLRRVVCPDLGAVYVFLLLQLFLGLPRDPKADGADNCQIFWHIALPLTRPALVVVALFEFQAAGTDLMRALIYLRDSGRFTFRAA